MNNPQMEIEHQSTTDLDPDSPLSIFISHKPEDAKSAQEIAKYLMFLGRPRLKVFVAEEVPFGSEYRPRTLQQLVRSDILILLYTDPHQNWDSCLYESGFFDGMLFPNSTKRLVVLHDEAAKPRAPLSYFRPVQVSATNRDELRRFVREVFAEPPRPGVIPINPELLSEECATFRSALEDSIIKAVCGSLVYREYTREVRIEVPEAVLEAAADHKVPAGARVFGGESSLNLFDLRERDEGYSWEEFYVGMDRVSDNTGDWAGALASLMKEIAFSNTHLTSTGLPLYRYQDETGRSQVYRPAVRSFRRKKEALSFTVVFTDLPLETTAEPAGAATALAQALTVARMLRWGVLKDLDNRIQSLITRRQEVGTATNEWQKQVAAEIHRFLGQKLTVVVEARNRGYRREEVLGYFEGPRKQEVDDILFKWDQWVERAKDVADHFSQDMGKVEDIRQLIRECLDLNKRYMVACAERYIEALRAM